MLPLTNPPAAQGPSSPCGTSHVAPLNGLYLIDKTTWNAVYGPAERDALEAIVKFTHPRFDPVSLTGLDVRLSDVEAIYTGWGAPRMDGAFLDRFPSLRVIFHAAGSVKSFVTDAMWDRGVRVTCAAQANAIPVAEFTLAQVILSLKQGWRHAFETRTARCFARDDTLVPSAYGSTVGVISLGATGRMVAERLRQLEVRIIAYDPFVSTNEAAELGVELCSLEALFAQAHVVTCHTPGLPSTTHLLREAHFAAMMSGATFINTARGSIVHEAEMVSVLARRPDLFALLDVTDPEPPPKNAPLFDLPNVVVTPHIAGSMGPECRRMARMIVEETRRFLAGDRLLGEMSRSRLHLLA